MRFFGIVGTPLLLNGAGGGGGSTFQKLSQLVGYKIVLLERGDKPEKGGLM